MARNPRVVIISGRRTSVRLEPVMWEAVHDIAARQGRSIGELLTEIERDRPARNLTSAIRVYVVEYYRGMARAALRRAADRSGHGKQR